MPLIPKRCSLLIGLLALCALALAACVPAPTPDPTATAQPPTAPALLATATAGVPVDAVVDAKTFRLAPDGLAFDAEGNLYVSECDASEILRIDPFGGLTIFAGGNGADFAGDGGPARSAGLNCPQGMVFDPDGSLYFADLFNHRIRRIDRDGIITTVVGSGVEGFSGDGGPAIEADLSWPNGIVVDAAGNLYISDSHNFRIRKVDTNGIISTVAGTGTSGYSGDGGPATAAQINAPTTISNHSPDIAIDAQGNLYLADSANSRVRRIDRQGTMTTVAGTGEQGASGDGGPATEAQLSDVLALAFDAAGNLYIATGPSAFATDSRVRRVDLNGLITTVAGVGEMGFEGDGGQATAAFLRAPSGLAFDADGNLFIADNADRVRKVDQNGIITLVAGGGY